MVQFSWKNYQAVKTCILSSADSGFSLQKYIVLPNAYLIHVQYSTKSAYGKKPTNGQSFHFKTLSKEFVSAAAKT